MPLGSQFLNISWFFFWYFQGRMSTSSGRKPISWLGHVKRFNMFDSAFAKSHLRYSYRHCYKYKISNNSSMGWFDNVLIKSRLSCVWRSIKFVTFPKWNQISLSCTWPLSLSHRLVIMMARLCLHKTFPKLSHYSKCKQHYWFLGIYEHFQGQMIVAFFTVWSKHLNKV